MDVLPKIEALQVWQKEAVRTELERMVRSRHFSQSRRYPALLRFMVEATLRGETDHLRERVIGSEVFGRDAAYDTNADPVVRMTAAEVRKRIAQYYQEIGPEEHVRIEVRSGSYVPIFIFPDQEKCPPDGTKAVSAAFDESNSLEPKAELAPAMPLPPTTEVSVSTNPRRLSRVLFSMAAAVLLLSAGLIAAWFGLHREKPQDIFWSPLLRAGETITVCVGQVSWPGQQTSKELSADQSLIQVDTLPFPNARALTNLGSFLQSKGFKITIRRAPETTLADLRTGPVVLLTGLDNQWTVRLQKQLRFQMKYIWAGTSGEMWIEDEQNLAKRWRLPINQTIAQRVVDYAMVARFTDKETGQPIVLVAGLEAPGNEAAVEFLTKDKYLQVLLKAVPPGKKNFEAVLGTSVVNGNQGQPELLAIESW
jgi:hypothetical protein